MTAEPTPTVSDPMPIWMSIPIIFVCLFSGGWIIHWYVMTDPIAHESTILGDPTAQANWQMPGARLRAMANASPRRYVRDHGNGKGEIRTEQARADVTIVNGKATFPIITYMAYDFVPADVKSTIYAARSLTADSARTTALKLTPQQIKQLRQLSTTINMAVTPADRDSLGAIVQPFFSANAVDRPALELKVLLALDDIANKSAGPTKQLATDRAKQINSIITPQMWSMNTSMGGSK